MGQHLPQLAGTEQQTKATKRPTTAITMAMLVAKRQKRSVEEKKRQKRHKSARQASLANSGTDYAVACVCVCVYTKKT